MVTRPYRGSSVSQLLTVGFTRFRRRRVSETAYYALLSSNTETCEIMFMSLESTNSRLTQTHQRHARSYITY